MIEIKEELKDRFGKIPDETLCFIEVSLIRLAYKTTPVLKINIFKTLLSFELKRADVSDCFLNRVLDFGKKGHYRFSFKEKTGRAVIVLSVSQKQKWFPVLIDCLSVFLK